MEQWNENKNVTQSELKHTVGDVTEASKKYFESCLKEKVSLRQILVNT